MYAFHHVELHEGVEVKAFACLRNFSSAPLPFEFLTFKDCAELHSLLHSYAQSPLQDSSFSKLNLTVFWTEYIHQ